MSGLQVQTRPDPVLAWTFRPATRIILIMRRWCATLPVFVLLACVGFHSAHSGDGVAFTDILPQSGVAFRHVNGATPEKYLIETMGGGCGFIDYDGDGWLDLYFVNGGPTRRFQPSQPLRNALYRNRRDGTFEDVTRQAGVPGNASYGMGLAVGDYDRDGDADLFVTNFGPNQLYRNNGDGTFTDVSETARVADPQWGTSAAWLDFDGDGRLDLYVVNYVDFSYDKNPYCGDRTPGFRGYCHPDLFNGVPDLLYRNNGDGTFSEVGRQAGIANPDGKGLGVVAGDVNGDGRVDLYVANDSVRNFLFRNNGDGTFTDIGLASGVGFDENGKPQAGMGTDMADYNGDGRPDLFVTNLDTEYNTIYRNLGRDLFQDVTSATGLGSELNTLNVGFGAVFLDYDNDGWKDLFVANGHILDNIEQTRPHIRYAQSKLLYRNTGKGGFADVTSQAGAALAERRVSRALAAGDWDNDGDLDLLACGCNEAPQLLRNDGGHRGNAVALRFEGTKSNREGIGVQLSYQLEGRTVRDQVLGGRSYLAAHDPRLYLGLGSAAEITGIEIRWPSGAVDRVEKLSAGAVYTIREGQGVAGSRRFTRTEM